MKNLSKLKQEVLKGLLEKYKRNEMDYNDLMILLVDLDIMKPDVLVTNKLNSVTLNKLSDKTVVIIK